MKKASKEKEPNKPKTALTLRRVFEIASWLRQINNMSLVKGEVALSLIRWALELDVHLKPVDVHKNNLIKRFRDEQGLSGVALDTRVAVELEKILDADNAMVEVTIPRLTASNFIADRDYKSSDIREGDLLVPLGVLRVLHEYLEEDTAE